jgi:hypothetical protein
MPGTVRPLAVHLQHRAQRALAAGLDLAVSGLEQDREVAVQPAAPLAGHPAEAVADRLDLFVVVQDEGQVVRGIGPRHAEPGGQPKDHRVAGLHVAGAAAVQPVAVEPAGHVVGDRHGVQVPGEHHPGGPAQVRPGQDGVADPLDLQTAQRAQDGLHGIGQRALRARDRRRVDQGAGEREDVGGEVEGDGGAHDVRA